MITVVGSLGSFQYAKDDKALRNFTKELARRMKKEFREGIMNPPKTGRKYSRLPNRSSRAGEFPANQTKALWRSVRSSSTKDTATVGSNKYYSVFLAYGTRYMDPRKMSKEVLQNTNKTFPDWMKFQVIKWNI